ncbi:MAG: cyanophycin synthetase, partial [Bacteroidota bacterium]
LQNTAARSYSMGLQYPADFKAKILENRLEGLWLEINDREVHCRLVGDFNAYNLLACYGVAILLEEEEEEVLTALSMIKGAEGRFEYLSSEQTGKVGIVDYAHTPDALQNVLETISELKDPDTKVLTVVGCGGDRDTTKRPKMARIGAALSDQLILTSDNPRTESAEAILDQMEAGLLASDQSKTLRITDREQAIRTACQFAKSRDIILVAGKGHEKYQEINGVKHPFDDKAQLLKYLDQ